MGWNIHRTDDKKTFSDDTIDAYVYIEQPQGFEIHNIETHICKLKKGIILLKTSS